MIKEGPSGDDPLNRLGVELSRYSWRVVADEIAATDTFLPNEKVFHVGDATLLKSDHFG